MEKVKLSTFFITYIYIIFIYILKERFLCWYTEWKPFEYYIEETGILSDLENLKVARKTLE